MFTMRVGISLLFTLYVYTVFAQTPSNNNVVRVQAQAPPPIFLRDVFSTPFEPKPYAGIQGSPYIGDGWMLAQIKLQDSRRIIDSLPIKINVYQNKIHFRNENGEEMQMSLRAEEIKIIDSSSTMMNTVFLSGFDQETGFFEVLTDGGKLKLLKKYTAFIWETKPLGSEVLRNFEMQGDLFLSRDKILYKASKSCSSIRDAFGNDERVSSYISANNIRCNKEEDMMKLVVFFASLQK
jgi:hypothetical protein